MTTLKLFSAFAIMALLIAIPHRAVAQDSAPSVGSGTLTLSATQPSTIELRGFDAIPGDPFTTTGVITTDGTKTNTYSGATTVFFKRKLVKASYVGIEVTRADATLRAQLKLPGGMGLAVQSVDDKGPSSGAVQEHDVLYKLDDQLLVNSEQFAVIVRSHKPGDKVTLTVIREAQPLTVTVTLVEKEVPELSSTDTTPADQMLSKLQLIRQGQGVPPVPGKGKGN